MTRPLLEPEAGTRPPRLGLISGLVLGVVAASVLSWLIFEATTALNRVLREGGENASLAFAGLFLVATGVVLGLVGFSGRFHPLVPGVPAIWLAIVLGPSLVGFGVAPWMPDFVNSFFMQSASPGIYLALGYLLLATGVAVYRRRRIWIFR